MDINLGGSYSIHCFQVVNHSVHLF